MNANSGADLPAFTVTAESGGTYSSTGTATADPSVTETNDALTVSLSTLASFTEGSATAGDAVTVATATDLDGDGTFTYSISDTTNYAIDATGDVTLTQAGADLVNANSGAALPAFTVTTSAESADAGS